MNLGFYMCVILVPVFGACAAFFALGKERAADFLSGFHFLPEEERAKYDRRRMAADARNDFVLWCVVMLFGALCSLWISGYAAVAAYVIWIFLFFKNVHMDMEKAFGKYRTIQEMDSEKDGKQNS